MRNKSGNALLLAVGIAIGLSLGLTHGVLAESGWADKKEQRHGCCREIGQCKDLSAMDKR